VAHWLQVGGNGFTVVCVNCGIEYWADLDEEKRLHRFGCPHWTPRDKVHQCSAFREPDDGIRYREKLGRWRLSTKLEDDDGEPVRDGWIAETYGRSEDVEGFITVSYCPFCGAALFIVIPAEPA
jgi:hypothetical protein